MIDKVEHSTEYEGQHKDATPHKSCAPTPVFMLCATQRSVQKADATEHKAARRKWSVRG